MAGSAGREAPIIACPRPRRSNNDLSIFIDRGHPARLENLIVSIILDIAERIDREIIQPKPSSNTYRVLKCLSELQESDVFEAVLGVVLRRLRYQLDTILPSPEGMIQSRITRAWSNIGALV